MPPDHLFIITVFCSLLTAIAPGQMTTAYEGFGDYTAGAQLESGSNGSSGTPLDGGLGWAGPLKIGESYAAVVAPPPFELRFAPDDSRTLRWSALLGPAVLQSTPSLDAGPWLPVEGPFGTQGTEFVFPIPAETGSRQFFRLWRP